MIEPLHVATIGEHQLRFFRRPINDGKPDLPWHSVDDLHRCLGLDQEERKFFLNKLHEWGGLKTVATADGIVVIAPHYLAQGVLDAMVEQGGAPASVRTAYDHAGIEATKKLTAHLALGSAAWMAWMKAAMNRPEEEPSWAGDYDDKPEDKPDDEPSDHR